MKVRLGRILFPKFWWSAADIAIAQQLNIVTAALERVMAEKDDLRTAWDSVKKEVGQAVAKFIDQATKLEAALAEVVADDGLKAEAMAIIGEMKATATELDTKFQTPDFEESGN